MRKLLLLFLTVGLVGCGAPHNFININVGKDGKDGANGSNGSDGLNNQVRFYFNDISLGRATQFGPSVEVITDREFRVKLTYDMPTDQWRLYENSSSRILFESNDCGVSAGDVGILTGNHERYDAEVKRLYDESLSFQTVMLDKANDYADIEFSNIRSFLSIQSGVKSCITDSTQLAILPLLNFAIFDNNDPVVSGWDHGLVLEAINVIVR